MHLNNVLDRMAGWYKAGITYPDNPSSIYLKAPPGRGKTTTMRRAPKIIGDALGMNLGFVLLNGANLTEMHLMGYLVPRHRETYTESTFSTPFFWTLTQDGRRLEEYDGGIIFVDEEDKAPPEVKKILGEGRMSGMFGQHKLPKNWVVWGAGNRSMDRSGSTKEFDHLIQRRMEIELQDDLESTTDWMGKNDVTPITISFTKQYPLIIFPEKPPEVQGPFCTPRSIVQADEYLRVITPAGASFPDDPCTQEEISGKIGGPAAAQYFGHIKLDREMPPFERIVADPKGVKVPTAADAQMLICFNLAHRVTAKTSAQVITYVERMPKDFSLTFAQAACNKQPLLVIDPAFSKWCSANSSLMAVIARHK